MSAGPGQQAPASALDVLVLGMHRSGTSAVAGALISGGLQGGPEAAMESFPRVANPAGYSEQRAVVALDDRMLAALGWRWDAIPSEPLSSPTPLPELVAEGRETIRSVFGEWHPWVLKDPRMSVLLPWWRQIVLDRVVAVVAIRRPDEVAWSLSLRDGMPVELGTALWLAYYRHLCRGLSGLATVVVDFGALSEQPRVVVPALIDALRRYGIHTDWTVDDAVASMRTELRRATMPSEVGVTADLDAMANEAFALLLPGGPIASIDRFDLELPSPSMDEEALLRNRTGDGDGAERVQARIAEAAVEIDRLGTQLDLSRATLATATQERDALRSDLAKSERNLDTMIEVVAKRSDGRSQILRGVRALGRSLAARLPRAARPNPLFDAGWYAATYPDAGGSVAGAYDDYRRHGWREGRNPNQWLDTGWYLATYPDVARAGLDPLEHYQRFGAPEGRNPGPDFDGRRYLRDNPDVAATGQNPLAHYMRHGRAEGRQAFPIAHSNESGATG